MVITLPQTVDLLKLMLEILLPAVSAWIGAYYSIRIQLTRIETDLEAHKQHNAENFGRLESAMARAHERIDEVLQETR